MNSTDFKARAGLYSVQSTGAASFVFPYSSRIPSILLNYKERAGALLNGYPVSLARISTHPFSKQQIFVEMIKHITAWGRRFHTGKYVSFQLIFTINKNVKRLARFLRRFLDNQDEFENDRLHSRIHKLLSRCDKSGKQTRYVRAMVCLPVKPAIIT